MDALGLPVEPISIELPGHGDAEYWDRSRDYSDQALEIALDRLPREPVPLIGHSYGAVLALRIAIERPGRVSSLVMIEPPFFAALRGSYSFDKIQRDMSPFAQKMADGQAASATKHFVELWGDGTRWNDIEERARRGFINQIDLILASNVFLWDDPAGLLSPERLEGLEIPVTLVEGSGSHSVMPKIVDAIGRRIPDAEGITVPDAMHMVAVTHPASVAEAIRDRLVWEAGG